MANRVENKNILRKGIEFKMKKSKLYLVGGIVGGFVGGVLFTCLLYSNAITKYQMTLRYRLLGEQQLLASRAERENDNMRAFVHRWNAVDALSEDGFRIFRPEFAENPGGIFTFPLLGIGKCGGCGPPTEKSLDLNRGHNRGHLALAMEEVGMEEVAKEQWEMACQIYPHPISVDDLRKCVLKIRELNNSEQSIAGERAVLGN
jgi:hypothetical protein